MHLYHKGDFLFRQGENFGSLYAIRAGSIKTYSVSPDGEEQINGFYFPGELVGSHRFQAGPTIRFLAGIQYLSSTFRICSEHGYLQGRQ